MSAAPKQHPPRVHTNPIREFLHPGRRRTDNPLVVGLVVMGIVFIAVCSAMSTFAAWAMSGTFERFSAEMRQIQQESLKVRGTVISSLDENSKALYRLCVISAKTREEAQNCTAPKPFMVPPGPPPSSTKPKGR
jgi:hypothetical protein